MTWILTEAQWASAELLEGRRRYINTAHIIDVSEDDIGRATIRLAGIPEDYLVTDDSFDELVAKIDEARGVEYQETDEEEETSEQESLDDDDLI